MAGKLRWELKAAGYMVTLCRQPGRKEEGMLLLSTLSPLTQLGIPVTRTAPPTTGGLPTSVNPKNITPTGMHAQMFISQGILDSVKLTIDSNCPQYKINMKSQPRVSIVTTSTRMGTEI